MRAPSRSLVVHMGHVPKAAPGCMKALSVLQPYTWLLAHGFKDVENRNWATDYRGPVLLHAGLNYPKRLHLENAAEFPEQYGCSFPVRDEMTGGIVGIADLVDCVTHSTSQWFSGPYGFVFANARPLPLVPSKGALGFFDVPADIVAQLAL